MEALFLYQKLVRNVLGEVSHYFVPIAAAVVWCKQNRIYIYLQCCFVTILLGVLRMNVHMITLSTFYTAVVPIVVVGISAGAGYRHYVNPF